MAKAKKLPSGSWRVQLYIGKDDAGKRRYKSFTAATKKEAEAAAALYSVQKKQKDAIGMTVGDAIDKYIESKENVLSPSTIRSYRSYRKSYLQGIMDVPLDELDNRIVQAAVNRDAIDKSPKTLRNAHGLLSAALGVYLPDMTLRTTMPAKEHKIREMPTPAEVMELVYGTPIELPCLLAIWMGMRMSEVRGIRYSDISGNILTIRHTKILVEGEDIVRDQTKNYTSTRQLRLPAYILDLIEQSREENGSEYIVTLSGAAIYCRLKRLLAKHGLPHIRFHDLRHLNASVMHELGVPDKYAMERGGWSTNSVLQSVYQHTFSEKRKSVDDQIDAYFNSIMQHDIQHRREETAL